MRRALVVAAMLVWMSVPGVGRVWAAPATGDVQATTGLGEAGTSSSAQTPDAMWGMREQTPTESVSLPDLGDGGTNDVSVKWTGRASGKSDPLQLVYLGSVLLCGAGLCVWRAAHVEQMRAERTAKAEALPSCACA